MIYQVSLNFAFFFFFHTLVNSSSQSLPTSLGDRLNSSLKNMFNSATFSLLITCQQGLLFPFHLWFSWCLVFVSHSFCSWCNFFHVPFPLQCLYFSPMLIITLFFHPCFYPERLRQKHWLLKIYCFVFWCGPLKKNLHRISCNIASVFCSFWFGLVFWSRGMWHLSSPTGDRTHTPCFGRRSLNHWTTREDPKALILGSGCFDDYTLNIL